jgi:predicted MFS family arabinose efflux permease
MPAPTAPSDPASRMPWRLVLCAAAILLITTGARQSLGLYIAPLEQTLGLGLAQISLALAVGQFVWGAAQPLCGAIADRYGPSRVLVGGAALLALGFGLTPYVHTTAGLVWTLGVLSAAGAGASGFSILIGATAGRIAPPRRGFAAGVINAGASFGQFLFAPLNLALIGSLGWRGAIGTMALLMLLTLPLAWALRQRGADGAAPGAPRDDAPRASGAAPAERTGLKAQLALAARDRSYWLLHLGFFTCGFHIAFLTTHLPTEVDLCGLSTRVAANSLALIGLANIAGSLGVGALGSRMRLKWLLCWVYLVRALAILVYLAAPHTPSTFYLFAAVLGLTWLSTVPPTAGLVGKLFGTRYLATLFGLTVLTHQIGAFLGAWLGGVAMTRYGNYTGMWIADSVLALGAALINLPIREARLRPQFVALRA